MGEWLDPNVWTRAGRGRLREFPGLTPGDVVALVSKLPSQYAPYLLVAHELVGQGRDYVPKVTRIEPAEIGDYAERGVWLFYILSEVLSPGVAAHLGVQSQRSLSTNGAISLHYPREARRKGEPPSLGLVDRVANAEGEVIEHRDYLRIYESMTRAARKLSQTRTG